MNPKDRFDFNEILWSFLDQSRKWGHELRTLLGLGEFNSIVLSCAKDSSNWGVTSSHVYIP